MSQLPSHFCFHFSHFAQPKDTHLRLLIFTQILDLQHGLKRNSANICCTQFKCILILYMPFSLQLELPPFCHQSSTSTPCRNHSYQEYIACHSVVTSTMEIKYSNYQSQHVKSTIF